MLGDGLIVTSPRSRRFARSALLLTGSAVLAGVAALLVTPRFAGARIPPLHRLPWPAEVRAGLEPPLALLYVQSGCSHCSHAAAVFDSVLARSRIRAIIATNDSRADASEYGRKLALQLPVTVDSGGALIHALGTRAVPTLVLFHADGSRQLVVGFTSDARYRATLEEFLR